MSSGAANSKTDQLLAKIKLISGGDSTSEIRCLRRGEGEKIHQNIDEENIGIDPKCIFVCFQFASEAQNQSPEHRHCQGIAALCVTLQCPLPLLLWAALLYFVHID